MTTNPFEGEWAYRSFLRNPDLSVEFNDLRFGAGDLIFRDLSTGLIEGTLGGTGWSLSLQGRYELGTPNAVVFEGKGELGGEQWVYNYHGFLSPFWPNGVDERPAILGTIVRAVPHSQGQAKAGFVASWIAVKK